MAGVKADIARALAAIIGAAAVAVFSCTDPGAFLKAVNVEAKSSLDMYLEVTGVTPDRDAAGVNPSSEIRISFDRAIDPTTIIPANITVAKAGGGAALGWSSSYDAALKRLSLKPAGLDGGADYVVTIGSGLRGSNGEPLQAPEIWSFSTANIPGGSVWINATVLPGDEIQGAAYTRSRIVNLFIKGNTLVSKYCATETEGNLGGIIPDKPAEWTTVPFTLTDAQGDHTVWVLLTNEDASLQSSHISAKINYDSIAPNAPTGVAISSLTTHTPTWAWSSGKPAGAGETEGNGTYGYRLVTSPGGVVVASGTVSAASYASPGIADGGYRLYVKEFDAAGNESAETNVTMDLINAPPAAPTVSATSPTVDRTPAWTWTHDSDYGNGSYQYRLDGGAWTATATTSFTPGSNLADGTHTLSVIEQDSGGEWSASGSKAVAIRPYVPYNGDTGVSTRPTFRWREGLPDVGRLQFKDRSGDWPTIAEIPAGATSIKYPGSLSTGTTYTWRIQLSKTAFAPSENGASFTTTMRGF